VVLQKNCWINSIFYISIRPFIRKYPKGHRQGLFYTHPAWDETQQCSIIVKNIKNLQIICISGKFRDQIYVVMGKIMTILINSTPPL